MSKKYQPRLVSVADRNGDELISENVHLRAATVAQDQREARARREMLAYLEREDARLDALSNTPMDDDYIRRRPLGAPMATRIGSMPDPFATLAWDAIVADTAATVREWRKEWQGALALAVWSAACFLLGMLAR